TARDVSTPPRHDRSQERFRKERSSGRRIPTLPRERTKRFAAHAQGVSPGADCFRCGEQNIVEKMHGGRFSRLPLRAYEPRAGTLLRATAILRVAQFLSVSDGSKTAAAQSSAGSAIA